MRVMSIIFVLLFPQNLFGKSTYDRIFRQYTIVLRSVLRVKVDLVESDNKYSLSDRPLPMPLKWVKVLKFRMTS